MFKGFIAKHQELHAYQVAFDAAMQLFEQSQSFPEAERHLLTQQMLRSSRTVCANLAKAWQKRRHKGAFVAQLNAAETEAAETQTWLEFAVLCGYLEEEVGQELYQHYAEVLARIDRLIEHADAWVVSS